jgi:hypothetical protein
MQIGVAVILAPVVLAFAAQSATAQGGPQTVAVALAPVVPSPGVSLRWSPQGATVALKHRGSALVGMFHLGPNGTRAVAAVVNAAKDVMAVNVDGDDHRDLKKRYGNSVRVILALPCHWRSQ